MSGVPTKKRTGDIGLQLTFPAVYSDVYAAAKLPEKFLPSMAIFPAPLPEGKDLQAAYHHQKMLDAHRRAMNGVKDTATAKARYVKSPAGYYNLPPVVLSQRRFANASNGAAGIGGYLYGGDGDDQLRGGVLRTAQGQAYGRRLLAERAKQLDRIDAAATQIATTGEMPPEMMGDAEVGEAPVEATKAKLELVGFLQSLRDAFVDGGREIGSMVVNDYYKALKLLFRLAPSESREGLEDLLDFFDNLAANMTEAINKRAGADRDVVSELQRGVYLTREYIKKMLAAVDSSPKERKDLSRALVKSLGFSRTNIRMTPLEAQKTIERNIGEFAPEEEEEQEAPQPGGANAAAAVQRPPKEDYRKSVNRQFFTRLFRGKMPTDNNLAAKTNKTVVKKFLRDEFGLPDAQMGGTTTQLVAEARRLIAGAPAGQGKLRGRGEKRKSRAVGPFPLGIPEYEPPLGVPEKAVPLVRKIQARQAAVKFDPSPREAFGKRSGAYVEDAPPIIEPAAQRVVNPMRSGMKSAEMPVKAPKMEMPVFEGAKPAPTGGKRKMRVPSIKAIKAELKGLGVKGITGKKKGELKEMLSKAKGC